MDKSESRQAQGYPKVITDLPEADIPFKGIKAWIVQTESRQLVFFEMQPTAVVPEHSHNYPQWGMLIKGGMKLTVDGKTKTIRKGDEYLIPAHAKHSVTFMTKTRVMDLFIEKTRYKPKTNK
jgi:quercetin dioxygenase-like cupin family protein